MTTTVLTPFLARGERLQSGRALSVCEYLSVCVCVCVCRQLNDNGKNNAHFLSPLCLLCFVVVVVVAFCS